MISTQRVIRESCNGLNNSECVSLLKEETRISVEIQVVPQLEENRRTCKTGHDFQVLSKKNCPRMNLNSEFIPLLVLLLWIRDN